MDCLCALNLLCQFADLDVRKFFFVILVLSAHLGAPGNPPGVAQYASCLLQLFSELIFSKKSKNELLEEKCRCKGGPWLAPSRVTLPRRYMDCLCSLSLLFQFVDLGSRNVKRSSTFWLFQEFSILRQYNIIIYLLILGTRVGKFSMTKKSTKKMKISKIIYRIGGDDTKTPTLILIFWDEQLSRNTQALILSKNRVFQVSNPFLRKCDFSFLQSKLQTLQNQWNFHR